MFSRTLLASGLLSASLASALSPTYTEIFQNPLPIPPIATPYTSTTVDGQQIDFYEVTIEPFQKQIFPGLGPANLLGYDGFVPGIAFHIERGVQTVIRMNNNHSVDSVVHLHGSSTHSPWDGWAADNIQPGQIKDYYYPNDQTARSLWYHDHASGVTSQNCYQGLTAPYIIYDPAEDYLNLPTGDYDIPLMIGDKMYQADGDLVAVSDDIENFYGDIIQVNFQPWPMLEVEPRKYRFRLYNTAMSRPFDLHIEQSNGDWIDFQVIGSDSGLFGAPVTSNDVTMAMGERYEIVVDFSQYAEQNLTMKNAYNGNYVQNFDNTDLVMSFVVGSTVSNWTANDVPSVLNPSIAWPESKTEVDSTFRFTYGGDNRWTINDVDFDDVNNRVLARPPQGTVQRWEFVYASGPGVHDIHVHLVDFQIVSRTGGSRGVLPYESAGLKDIVLLEPGETVQVLAYFGPWNGLYMFHCHNLVHEDHQMMAAFNVTALAGLGYDMTEGLSDPTDSRFVAQDWSQDAYNDDAIYSTLSYLGNLGAYNSKTQIMEALSAYYSTDSAAATEVSMAAAAPTTTSTTAAYVPATSQTYAPVQYSAASNPYSAQSNQYSAYSQPAQTSAASQNYGQNYGQNHGQSSGGNPGSNYGGSSNNHGSSGNQGSHWRA